MKQLTERIILRLTKVYNEHLIKRSTAKGETISEYIRQLIKKDIKETNAKELEDATFDDEL